MTLHEYLLETGKSTAEFASECRVSRMTMYRYRHCDRVPIPIILRRIQSLSGGKVGYDDFIDELGNPKPSPKAAAREKPAA
jgi:hypothetical protein